MVSEFVERGSIPSPIVISPDQRTILIGVMLSLKDVESVLIEKEGKIVGAIYGYQIVSLINEISRDCLYEYLWRPVEQVREQIPVEEIPTVRLSYEVQEIFRQIVAKRFGDVLILHEEARWPIGSLSLTQILKILSSESIKVELNGLNLKSVSTPLRIIEERTPIGEILRFMVKNRVRRAVINREDKFFGCTERELVCAMFSMDGIQSLMDDPKRLLNTPLEKFPSARWFEIPQVEGNIGVEEAWRLARHGGNSSLVVDQEFIATPWDLIIKPYLQGNLPI